MSRCLKHKKSNLASSVSIAVFLMSYASHGLSAALEEVVVTAQKRQQSMNDVPIAINAFTGDKLEAMGVESADDLAMFTPGVTMNETAASGVPLYSIRGVGFQDYSTAATSTAGLNFDEVNMPYAVMTRGLLLDVKRVEVLKGPQGDLFGRNTTAGQINFISNKPTDEFEAGIHASYGSYETFDMEGYVSGPMSDSIQGRLAYKTVQSSEGWQKNLLRDDELGEKDSQAMRGLLNFDIGASASLLLNVHYVDDQSENQARTAYDPTIVGGKNPPYRPLSEYLLPGGEHFGEDVPWWSVGDNEAAYWDNTVDQVRDGEVQVLNNRPRRDNQLAGFSANLEWDIRDITLTSITGYNKFERDEHNQWTGSPTEQSDVRNRSEISVFSQEIRLSGNTDTITWMGGLYYSDEEVDEEYHYWFEDSEFAGGATRWLELDPGGVYTSTVLANQISHPPSAIFAANPINEVETRYEQLAESTAVFGNIEWSFADNWRLILGARYTDETRSIDACTYDGGDGSYAALWNNLFGASLDPGACGILDDIPESPNYIFKALARGEPNDAFHPIQHTLETRDWMYRTVVDYMFPAGTMVYGSVSHGFKSGGFNGANINTSTQIEPYGKEELTSYEIGAKATLLDGTMQLNFSAYYYDYKDKQETDLAVALVGNISGLTNIPKSELYGVDLDLNWQMTEALRAYLGVAYLETEILEWDAVDPASTFGNKITFDASGNELPMAPQWQVNANLNYDWYLANGMRISLAGDYAYQDETGGIRLQTATDDYWLMNGRVSLHSADERWSVMVWSRNITDEYYYTAAYGGGGSQWTRAVGMPRTVGITIDYEI